MKKTAKKSVKSKPKAVPRKPVKKAKPAKKAKPTAKSKPVKKVKSAAKSKAAPKKKSVKKVVVARKAVKKKVVAKPKPKPVVKAPNPAPVPAPPPPALTLGGSGEGTRDNPWLLKTPSGNSEFQAFRDEHLDPPTLVVWVGSTELHYHLRALNDLHNMLKAYGDWMLLGSTDEQNLAVEETVESWSRSPFNPVGGWYGLKPGLRGRFATFIPPVLEFLGLAEVEHFPKNNRMRAK